jgi:hypothetical protein
MAFAPAVQAETNRSWDQLTRNIRAGKKVVVTRMDKSKAEGRLIGITAESIKVHTGVIHKAETEVRREDVMRVRYADIRMRNTLIGLAAGVGLGAAIGAASDSSNDAAMGALAAAGLGGIGAAVGAVLPIGKPLYEVPKDVVRAGEPKASPERK